MGSERSFEEWKKAVEHGFPAHPVSFDEPGRRVFAIIDGDGPDGSDTHIGQLTVIRYPYGGFCHETICC